MGFRNLFFWPELPLASRLEPARLCPPQLQELMLASRPEPARLWPPQLRELTLASRPESARLYPPQPRQPSVHLWSLAAQFWARREWPALPRQQLHQG